MGPIGVLEKFFCPETPSFKLPAQPGAGLVIFDGQQGVKMGLAQFETHCVSNWKGFKKVPHIVQVGYIKTFAKFGSQPWGQLVYRVANYYLPPSCPK